MSHDQFNAAGGSAFPSSEESSDGMTLRDYFAAHAPAEPKFEFSVKMLTNRPDPILPDVGEWPANQDEITAWDVEMYKQRAIQWPYVWADAMLAERVR